MKPTYEELAEQLANAESNCWELAAENAGLKEQEPKAWCIRITDEVTTDPAEANMWRGTPLVLANIKTPATDAFLAEVRAQESKRVYESILDNPAVTDMASLVDWLEQNANDSVALAAQLRKGVAL